MPNVQSLEQFLNSLRKLAENECHLDDNEGIDLLDLAGNSIDDAYNVGYNDGQVMLARRLLKELTPE